MQHRTRWWNQVFGETYAWAFDQIYSPDRTAQEVDFVMRMLRLPRGSAILDVQCGQGRHAVALAQHGYRVTGVDMSETLLRLAKQRTQEVGVHARDCAFLRADVRKLRLLRRFHAAVILGNSFGYFSDAENERVIVNCSRFIVSRGHLLLDLPNAVGMLCRPLGHRTQRVRGGYVRTENRTFDDTTWRLSLRWTFMRGHRRHMYDGTLRLYGAAEVHALLERNGFSVLGMYGDFDGSTFNRTSPRLIVHGVRR